MANPRQVRRTFCFFRSEGGVGSRYYKGRVHCRELGLQNVVSFGWLCCNGLSLAGLFLDKENSFLLLGSKVVMFFLEIHRYYFHRSVSNTNMACRVLEFSLSPLDFILSEVSIISYILWTIFASFKNAIQLIRKSRFWLNYTGI